MYITSTHDTLIIFTDRGKAYGVKVYEIPEASRQARGKPLEHLVRLEEGEKVTAIAHITSETEGSFFMVTERGIVKRTAVSAFSNVKRNGIIAINLSEGDKLKAVCPVDGDSLVVIGTRNGRAVVFPSNQVREMGRTARGVRGVRLKESDEVVGMDVAVSGKQVLTVTERGFGKRTSVEEFRITGRGAQGVTAHKLVEKTGKLVDLKVVSDDDEVMIITKDGMAIRIPVSDIPVYGRATSGARLIQSDSEVVAVCRVKEND